MRKQASKNFHRKTATQRQKELTVLRLRRHVAYCLLALFTLNTLSALTIIFLVGYGQMLLSEKLVMTVLAATVAQAAAIFFSVTKYLFRE